MGDSNDSSDPHERIDEQIGFGTAPAGQETVGDGKTGSMTLEGDTDSSQRGPEERPPLPPRPSLLQTTTTSTIRPVAPTAKSPGLQAKATTAVSSVDIQTLSFPDGSRGTFSTPVSRSVSDITLGKKGGSPSRISSRCGSIVGGDDSASLLSCVPTLRASGDLASLLDEGLESQSPAWRLLSSQADVDPFESLEYEDYSLVNFEHEFNEIEAVDSQGGNEG